MVSVGYLIDNPGPPSGLKSFVNQRLMPPAIDAAGAVESAVYELSEYVRAQPNTSLLAAGALGMVAGALVFRRSRR
jgi:LPXTG-motif cell wall-anchored protein